MRSDFTGTDWEGPPRLLNCNPKAPQSLFFTHPQHTSNGTMGEGAMETERAQKNVKHTTKIQQKYLSFKDLFHISSSIPGPYQLPVHCHPVGGYLLDLSHKLKTHFHAQMKCVGCYYFHYFLYFPSKFIKRLDDTEFKKKMILINI